MTVSDSETRWCLPFGEERRGDKNVSVIFSNNLNNGYDFVLEKSTKKREGKKGKEEGTEGGKGEKEE